MFRQLNVELLDDRIFSGNRKGADEQEYNPVQEELLRQRAQHSKGPMEELVGDEPFYRNSGESNQRKVVLQQEETLQCSMRNDCRNGRKDVLVAV